MNEFVHATATTAVRADVQQAFDVVVPIDLTLIFRRMGPLPGVVGIKDQTEAWDHVGASRKPQLSDGTEAFERITVLTPPRYFAYEVSGFQNSLRLLVSGARGSWTFEPGHDGGAAIAWTYSFRPLRGRAAVVRLIVKPLWTRYMRRALEHVAREVDRQHGPATGARRESDPRQPSGPAGPVVHGGDRDVEGLGAAEEVR